MSERGDHLTPSSCASMTSLCSWGNLRLVAISHPTWAPRIRRFLYSIPTSCSSGCHLKVSIWSGVWHVWAGDTFVTPSCWLGLWCSLLLALRSPGDGSRQWKGRKHGLLSSQWELCHQVRLLRYSYKSHNPRTSYIRLIDLSFLYLQYKATQRIKWSKNVEHMGAD